MGMLVGGGRRSFFLTLLGVGEPVADVLVVLLVAVVRPRVVLVVVPRLPVRAFFLLGVVTDVFVLLP